MMEFQDHIDKLPISAEQMQEYQRRSLYRWQTYTEPGDEIENSLGGSPTKRPSRTVLDTGDELEPAPEGTLSRNLGLDLIVVVNKTDFITDLEKDYDYKDEHFDFIQQAVIVILDLFNFLNFTVRSVSFVYSTEPASSTPV